MSDITLNVNGDEFETSVPPQRTLLDALRDQLDFTDVKYTCKEGECGACTVLVDDKPICSCLMLAVQAEGKRIITPRGLTDCGKLHPVQQSFIEKGAVQCGYCTPGLVITGKALLDENPKPTEAEIREAISGNICRCTGYDQIVEAIQDAAEKLATNAAS